MDKINRHDLAMGMVLLRGAFADLRKQGFKAKMNYMCCGGCASSGIWQEIVAKPGKYIGGIFYHRQDHDRLVKFGEVDIGYGPPDQNAEDWAGLLVGHAIKNTMLRHGLIVEWSGKTEEKVHVKLPRGAA